jgi:dihydroxyacid dehydratase/phosphogluconate dehydratase
MTGVGRGDDCALIAEGRFSGATHGFCVGHVAPESLDGGPIVLVADGDQIRIDVNTNSIDLLVSEEELAERPRVASPLLPGTALEYWKILRDWPRARRRARSLRRSSSCVGASPVLR